MRALVISGGGSKGAFGGGVAQYLLEEKMYKYDILIGSSTGSLLIPHLALGKVQKIYDAYTNVNSHKIFNITPFVVKRNGDLDIVIKLFHMIKPHIAFFGQKDLQQVAVIKRLVKDLSFDIQLETVLTRRETDGLAMSSRNMRLNNEERQKALLLFTSLIKAKNQLMEGRPWLSIKSEIEKEFDQVELARLEYFELIHPDTFEIKNDFDPNQKSSICVAAYIGEVRLIDNLPIIP